MSTDASWEARSRAVWAEIDRLEPADFRARIDALAAELPVGDPVASFERGAAFDSTGHPERAVPLYRAALDAGVDAGLDPERRRRAVIQMASSIRNLGDPQQALGLLDAEAARPSDPLDAAVTTFRALALADLGREREALSLALTALAKTLPRYNRSAARYAAALLGGERDAD